MNIYDYEGSLVYNGKTSAWASIDIDYGRIEGTSYVFCRIPHTTVEGKKITPKIDISNASKDINAEKWSALEYAENNDTLFCINSGLGTLVNNIYVPMRFTIINGVSITNTPGTSSATISDNEQYPLCIYEDGHMDSPYWNRLTCDTAAMIASGVKYAVTAWGTLIYDFEKTGTDKFNELVHAGEHIPQQVVGQFQNGDYFTFTCDGVRGSWENETGLTYTQVQDLLVSKGVKFAYSLDGGGSCETVIGERQLNPIYENTKGRKVPTILYFEVED